MRSAPYSSEEGTLVQASVRCAKDCFALDQRTVLMKRSFATEPLMYVERDTGRRPKIATGDRPPLGEALSPLSPFELLSEVSVFLAEETAQLEGVRRGFPPFFYGSFVLPFRPSAPDDGDANEPLIQPLLPFEFPHRQRAFCSCWAQVFCCCVQLPVAGNEGRRSSLEPNCYSSSSDSSANAGREAVG
jgi:hypothetical protein